MSTCMSAIACSSIIAGCETHFACKDTYTPFYSFIWLYSSNTEGLWDTTSYSLLKYVNWKTSLKKMQEGEKKFMIVPRQCWQRKYSWVIWVPQPL